VTALFLYDDAIGRAFEPFALTRPTSELRGGALLQRERWEYALGMKSAGVITSAHLRDFDEPWGISAVSGMIPKGSILANSRCALALAPVPAADSWRCGDRIAAVILDRDLETDELEDGRLPLERLVRDGNRQAMITGRWVEHVWDFIGQLGAMLTDDIRALTNDGLKGRLLEVDTEHPVFVEEGATIEPHVFFDSAPGPVLVRRGATIQAFSRIIGPCFVGHESIVGFDKIATASIGEQCRVHGELNTVIFLGHANKAHDGFLGHSYLGRWVNLGAGTITSNLKNTYGSVQLWTPVGERDTGLQFLGSLIGDHAKTGIGTSLSTGTVIGAGANIYGARTPNKVVPPFAWGERAPFATYRPDKFLDVARRVMARRHVDLTDKQARQLKKAHEHRWRLGEEYETR
jgi:UDP-N-acetylglucosamine diphosphorylase / glucose-1-phosphate thymidylyltransferase / UDP-N-acetylgalactosamine diphosphorylase / glucosamine-1-phosphate N-acetyltransferase / galactosamine-1-phosphate N-acetyltransferase